MKNIELKEMQEIEKNILKYIDEICRKNNIEYTVSGGTAIGTIRHDGFIPWDDDVDIGLTPTNYDKLIKCIKEDNDERYKVLDYKNEETYIYPFAKVVDTKTILYEDNKKDIKNYGVFVDVFKYYGIPNNFIYRYFYFNKLKRYQRYLSYLIFNKISTNNYLKKIVKNFMRLRAKKIGTTKLLNKFEGMTEKYQIENTNYCTNNWPMEKRKNQVLDSKIFTNGTIRHKFEDIEVSITKEYHKYLTTAYGDYLQLPPEDKRKPPHPSNVFWKE